MKIDCYWTIGVAMNGKIIIAILLLAIGRASFAQESSSFWIDGGVDALLATRDSFAITVYDEVKDGCLPNPGRLKEKMEISLRKYGFDIQKEPKLNVNTIAIRALGGRPRNNELCVVHISTTLIINSVVNVPFADKLPTGNNTLVPLLYPIRNALITINRTSMQSHLAKKVVEFSHNLYLDVSRAKDDIFLKFPSIRDEYLKSKNSPNDG